MSKVEEIIVTVGQTIQIKQFEPRVYSASIKMSIDEDDDINEVFLEASNNASNKVKEYFENLNKPVAVIDPTAVSSAMKMPLRPEILTQPNVPKPLHGIAPRTIMGDKWWNKTRQEVYKSTDYHCVACGVAKENAKGHAWLEAHEYWDIDYINGTAKIQDIVPLCHYCHNFIHSGRLSKILGGEKSEVEVKAILEHGFKVLSDNHLDCFPNTLELANNLGVDTHGVKPYELPDSEVLWPDWKLIFEGKEYKSKFKDINEWQEFYDAKNNETKE